MNVSQQRHLHPMNTQPQIKCVSSQGGNASPNNVSTAEIGVSPAGQGGNSACPQISRKTTVTDGSDEESSQQGDDTDFGSETDAENEDSNLHACSDKTITRQPSLKTANDASPNALKLGQDGNINLSTVPPALLDEIRRMIQHEFGIFSGFPVVLPQHSSNAQQGADRQQPTPFTSKSSTPPRSPTSAGYESNSNKVRPRALLISPRTRYFEPALISASSEKAFSPQITTPTSPERQIIVRFADDVPQKSALDGKWGELFDKKSLPTKRLEQILKGLANYVTDEFMPQKSIVIPPEKMAAFYSLHKLHTEIFPYVSMFKCRSKGWNMALADIYQDLACEYHLIQKDDSSKPSIPALTPTGFAKWIATGVMAYPDAEASRLTWIFSELPVSADGTAERLPKQLPRHLLPDKSDKKLRRLLDDCLRDFAEDFLPLPGSSHNGPKSLSRTESSPQPRATKLDKYDERDHRESSRSTRKETKEHHDTTGRTSHDGHNATRRHWPQARPTIGPLARTLSEQVSPTTKLHAAASLPALPAIASARPPAPIRTRTSPVTDTYPTSTKDAILREIRDRETEYQACAPRSSAGDYLHRSAGSDYTTRSAEYFTPRSAASGYTLSSLRSGILKKDYEAAAVPERGESVNPGPTWGQYLSSRSPGLGERRSAAGVGYRGSI